MYSIDDFHISDSPILLSFPHFYLANDSYRTALEGISPPDPEKHNFYIDVQPVSTKALALEHKRYILRLFDKFLQ